MGMLHILQWLYTYVASFCSQYFICFFRRMCKVFIWMLQGFQVFSGVFAIISDACFKCFICLWTYVASVASRCCQIRSSVASPSSLSAVSPRCLLPAPVGHPPPHPPLIDAGDVRGGAGPAWARRTAREMDCRHVCPDAPSSRCW